MDEIPAAAALKLARAEHHITDLNGKAQAYLDQRPFKIVRRFNPETGNLSLATKTDIPIPDEMAVITGDAVHNLRSALDFAYFAIISRYTEREDNIQFPIWRDEGNRKASVLGRRLVELAPKQVRTAIEECEPYPGGRYSLYELDALDVRDKHRFPIFTMRAAPLKAAVFNLVLPESGVKIGGPGGFEFIGKGDEMFTVQLPVGHPSSSTVAYEHDVGLRPDFSLIFGDGPFENRRLVPCLVDLAEKAKLAIEAVWRAAN